MKLKLKLEEDKEEEQFLGEGVARLRLLRFVRSQVCAQPATLSRPLGFHLAGF